MTEDRIFEADGCVVEAADGPGQVSVRTGADPADERAVEVDAAALRAALVAHLEGGDTAESFERAGDRRPPAAVGCDACGFAGSVSGHTTRVAFCPACGGRLGEER